MHFNPDDCSNRSVQNLDLEETTAERLLDDEKSLMVFKHVTAQKQIVLDICVKVPYTFV